MHERVGSATEVLLPGWGRVLWDGNTSEDGMVLVTKQTPFGLLRLQTYMSSFISPEEIPAPFPYTRGDTVLCTDQNIPKRVLRIKEPVLSEGIRTLEDGEMVYYVSHRNLLLIQSVKEREGLSVLREAHARNEVLFKDAPFLMRPPPPQENPRSEV